MDRAAAAVTAKPSSTPITEGARFRITDLDVGTEAVRPGCMAVLEDHRKVLLTAATVALHRIKSSKAPSDAVTQYALQTAIDTVTQR